MTVLEAVYRAAPEVVSDACSPNQFHLRGSHLLGPSVRISYYPDGAGQAGTDDPIVMTYHDTRQTVTFRESRTEVVPVAGLGTCVTVTVPPTPDEGATTLTLLVPWVVLPAGQPAPVRTELITALHHGSDSGVGYPQRDQYTVTSLTGTASRAAVPL